MNECKTPWFAINNPELGMPFNEFCLACSEKGVLDKKIKRLLTLVLATCFQSDEEVERQIESAIRDGVSREEIIESLLISAACAAKARLECHKDIFLRHFTGVRCEQLLK